MARFVKFEANGLTHFINPDMVARVSPVTTAERQKGTAEWHKSNVHLAGSTAPLPLADTPDKIVSRLTAA